MISPTKKQLELLNFVRRFHAEHGYAPTLVEAAREFGICKSAAFYRVAALKKKKLIRSEGGSMRTLALTEAGKLIPRERP